MEPCGFNYEPLEIALCSILNLTLANIKDCGPDHPNQNIVDDHSIVAITMSITFAKVP